MARKPKAVAEQPAEDGAYDPYTPRSPAEESAAGAESPPANSELTPEERKALMMDHYRSIGEAKETLDEARKEYNRRRKLAKADNIKLADIDFMFRCADVDDADIIVCDLKRQAEIAAWFALPVEFQPDMFGSFDREPGEERAEREGRKAGATGFGSNPYDENSKQGRAWAKAWREEQAKAREALQSAMLKRNALKEDANNPEDPFEDEPAGDDPGGDREFDEADPAKIAAE